MNQEKVESTIDNGNAPSAQSAALPHDAQSLPLPPHSTGAVSNNYYHPSTTWEPYPVQDRNENAMGGFHATTLVGVGGLIGWTAAAAYRWLNGGEFAMFPPPPSHSTSLERQYPSYQNNLETATRNYATNQHTTPNQSHTDDTLLHDSLTEQVQRLLQALQKQSTENHEMIKRWTQQQDAQQTNASMQRLRTPDMPSLSSSSASFSTAVYTKLAEVQAELSSLRRDVRQHMDETVQQQWDKRLTDALDNVQESLTRLLAPPATPRRQELARDEHDDSVMDHHKTSSIPDDKDRVDSFVAALKQLILENDLPTLRVGAQLLYLYVVNLASHPTIPRYRKIFTSNESFQRVNKLNGGRALLKAVGFRPVDNSLEWHPGDEEETYLQLLSEASTVLGILKSPGRSSPEELLEQALGSLSVSVKDEGGHHDTALSMMVCKTPDPSIVSPPATKKQGAHTDAAVTFSFPVGSDDLPVDESMDNDQTPGTLFSDESGGTDAPAPA